jgi:tetratricopeptide (TPR) repeat protein
MPRRSAEAEKDSKEAKTAAKAAAGSGKDAGGAAAAGSEAAAGKKTPRTLPLSGPGRFGGIETDPALGVFTEGMAALYRKDWAKAQELFEQVTSRKDIPELADRARLLVAAARGKAAEDAAAKGKDVEGQDPYLRALYEKNRGNAAVSLEMSQKDGRDQKDERFAYLVAAIHAAENRTEEAARALARAIELNPKNRIHAYHDPDFAELRRNRDHRPLFGLS